MKGRFCSLITILAVLFSLCVLLSTSAVASTDDGVANDIHTHEPVDKTDLDQANLVQSGSIIDDILLGTKTKWYIFSTTDYSTVRIVMENGWQYLRFGITDTSGNEILWENDFPDQYDQIWYDLPTGTYCLFVANELPYDVSYTFYFETSYTYAPPVITVQPENTSVLMNDNVEFYVAATGAGLTYQWQYRTSYDSIWIDCAIPNSDTTRLSFLAAYEYNGYQYRCVVTDREGIYLYSQIAELDVTSIYVTEQPSDVAVSVGTKAYFTTNAYGIDVKYQWQWSTDGNRWANTTLTGCQSDTLTVTAISSINGRKYRCIVTDGYGNSAISTAAKLSVKAKPRIITQPKNQTASSGYVYFFAQAVGSHLSYQWQYSANGGKTWNPTSLAGCNSDTLRVMASSGNNQRQYRCIINDEYGGSVVSSSAKLIWGTAFNIISQPEDQKAPNGKVCFIVQATGDGLKYQWQYSADGKKWSNTTLPGYDSDTLTVSVNSTTDGRQYRCVIVDQYGNCITSRAATLIMGTAIVITAQPQNQTAHSGYVYFTVSAEGSNLSYQWQYSANGGKTWNSTSLLGYDTDTLRVRASANTDRRLYRCVITDQFGWKVNSKSAQLFCN